MPLSLTHLIVFVINESNSSKNIYALYACIFEKLSGIDLKSLNALSIVFVIASSLSFIFNLYEPFVTCAIIFNNSFLKFKIL